MDVGPKDPTKIEARSPQPGRSGFLNSAPQSGKGQARGPVGGSAVDKGPQGRSPAPSAGLASPLAAKGLERLFSGIGLRLGPELLARVGERVAAALVHAREASVAAQGRPQLLDSRQRAVSAYKRVGLSSSRESTQPGKARFLALLEGLFAAQGLDLSPEELLALDADLDEGGGGQGEASTGDRDREEASGAEDRDVSSDNADSSEGQRGGEVRGGKPIPEAEGDSDTEAFAAMVKDFFGSGGGSPGPWLEFRRAAARSDPAWMAFPFAFSANNVDFSGIFRVLCTREQKAVLSLGADFRSNGHDYSFTLSASSLALEGPAEADPGREAILGSLADSLKALGIDFAYSPLRGIEGAWTGGEEWA